MFVFIVVGLWYFFFRINQISTRQVCLYLLLWDYGIFFRINQISTIQVCLDLLCWDYGIF